MPIMTVCPHCRRKAKIAPDAAGKTVRCSGCGESFDVALGTGDLLVEWGPVGSGRRVPLLPGQTVVIGRSRECGLCLPGPLVSRRHATLDWTDGEWVLRDRMSANGTFVNGARVRALGLTDGCRIVIGDFALRLAVASVGPSLMDTALDAMALDETRSGAMAIVGADERVPSLDPLAETAPGSVALEPPVDGAGRRGPSRRPLLERWPVVAVLVIAVVVLVVLLIRAVT